MRRFSVAGAAIAFAATLITFSPAQAVDVTVTYSIGGGTFHDNDGFYSSPVTGGTLVLTFRDALTKYSRASGDVTLERLTLTGPLVFFSATKVNHFPFSTYGYKHGVGSMTPLRDLDQQGAGAWFDVYTRGWPQQTRTINIYFGDFDWRAYGPSRSPRTRGYGHLRHYRGTWGAYTIMQSFSFTPMTGQEISRTPEPGTASLVLLGLVGLAGAGGGRRFLRRR